MPEQIFRGVLRGPLTTKAQSAVNQWAGRTVISSGVVTVVISTTSVRSDSLIFLEMQAVTDQASGFAKPIEVKSINPGRAFVVGWADGLAVARNTTIMWLIYKTS